MNQELNQTPEGICHNLPLGLTYGAYNQLFAPNLYTVVGAPTMNPLPWYAPQHFVNWQQATPTLPWYNTSQGQTNEQPYGMAYQQGVNNVVVAKEAPGVSSFEHTNHLSTAIEALKKMISQVTTKLGHLKVNPPAVKNQSQYYNN